MDGAGSVPGGEAAREAGAVARMLCELIAARLGTAPAAIPVHRPLHDLGLDSKAALDLVVELERRLERPLSPSLIWQFPTVSRLARRLAAGEAEAEIRTTERPAAEPVAVIGLALRFPGAGTAEAFWRLLDEGGRAIVPWPAARGHDPDGWDFPPYGGFLEDVAGFDAALFGISPREATLMDPQHRLLLETAWRTFESARLPPERLAGREIGTFIGISTSDYAHEQLARRELIGPYLASGNAKSIAANRLAYQFDFCGPSLAIDTACSSSLVAVHMACESVRSGASEFALAGGVNVILRPETSASLAAAGMLAPDGYCKTFDAAADGYVRAEGCGLVLLRPLAAALDAGDPIQAVILGSATNQDGRTNGLNAPSGAAQRRVIQRALQNAGVAPATVAAVETHGTGTAIGDLIEVEALRACYGEDRAPDDPIWLGGVKAAIGHLEAAAGVAGLIKTVLSLQHRRLPAQPSLRNLNPALSVQSGALRVAQAAVDFSRKPLRLGVSSFGFGGSNAHLILEAAPEHAPRLELPAADAGVMPFSFHADAAKAVWANTLIDWVEAHPTTSPRVLAGAVAAANAHHAFCCPLVFRDRAELLERLRAVASSAAGANRSSLVAPALEIIFAPSGEGLWTWMQVLCETDEGFRAELLKLEAGVDCPLLNLLYAEDPATPDLQALSIFGQLAYLAAWRARGVQATRLRGVGDGILAAAVADGRLRPAAALDMARDADAGFADPFGDLTASADVGGLRWAFGTEDGWRGALGPGVLLPESSSEADIAWFEARALADYLSAGGEVDWEVVYPGGRRGPDAPPYPLLRKPFWLPDPAAAPPPAGEAVRPAWRSPRYAWEPCWEPLDLSPAPRPGASSWVVIGEDAFAQELASRLKAEVISFGAVREPEGAETLNDALATARRAAPQVGLVVVPAAARSASDPASLAVSSADLARLVHLARSASKPDTMILLTRGAAAGVGAEIDISLAQSALIGCARSLFREAPELAGACLDLDATASAAEAVDVLRMMPDGETELVVRDGRLRALRFRTAPTGLRRFQADPDGVYLVTGGVGGVGRLIVDWFVARGARRLIVTRRGPVHELPESFSTAAARWRAAGVVLDIRACDASDATAMRTLLSSLPPIAGVVHAAGVAEPRAAQDVTPEHVAAMIGPKLVGADVLDEACEDLGLFLLISSISGTWGASGLSAYGAANHLLNAIAFRRRDRGQAGTALALGPIAAGMMVREEDRETLAQVGLLSLTPDDVFAALDQAATGASAMLATMVGDVRRYSAVIGARRRDRSLDSLVSEQPTPAPGRAVPPLRRRQDAGAAVREEIVRILGAPEDEIDWSCGFFDLGLDSRAMLELRDRISELFGLDLPPSIAFDYPTMAEIVGYIEVQLSENSVSKSAPA
jgi:acyl transferase domain-containing protein/acyl carrier protein/NAD(P)-dependent dehydrogenase (short-subunit alcohol dehydrogenase family)